MNNYLSFGGGVNSVAMYLLMIDKGLTPGDPANGFEAIFANHKTDWRETYIFLEMFIKRGYPITVLDTGNLYEYYRKTDNMPYRIHRSCSIRFKAEPINKYIEKPCFMNIGFDAGESHRAKLNYEDGVENRFPLIEEGLDRNGCIELIKSHGLPVPMKSGCFVCPFQKPSQFKELRHKHPDLFCKAQEMERASYAKRQREGKIPYWLIGKSSLEILIEENQEKLFKEDEYPPCECML